MFNRKGKIYNFFILLWEMFREMPSISISVFIIPLLSGMLSVFIYSSQANIINIVVHGLDSKEWNAIFSSISKPLFIIVLISAVQSVTNLVAKVNGNKLKESITLIFQSKIIDITNSVEYINYDDKDFCDKLQRAKTVVGEDLVNILFNFTSAINIGASLLSIILLSMSTGFYSITIIISVMIIVNLSIKMSTELKVRKLNRDLTLEGRMGDYLNKILSSSGVVREMRIYNSAGYFFSLWSKMITGQHNKRMNARRTEIKVGTLTTTIQSITIFVVMTSLINRITISNNVSIGLIATLFLALIQCSSKILTLTWPLSKLYMNCSRLYDFHEFLNLKQESFKDNIDNNKSKKEELTPIVISNVNFSYKNSSTRILSNINLIINKNEKVAIVGANGAGKSTLIKLVLGLYSPGSGLITWNGNNKAMNKISVIFQDYIRFELTLRENIAFGNVKDINNDNLILETMRKCNCFDLFEELGSLDVPVGRIIEGGRELSGGQWQKLAISRSIFSDSDLLIFDEPTASIDPNSEVEIYNSIIKICENKTAIFISHRLGWAKNADRIVVIDNGTIVEIGTHDQLISLSGIYSNMYNTQSSWYKD